MVPIKKLFFRVRSNAVENLDYRDAYKEKADIG